MKALLRCPTHDIESPQWMGMACRGKPCPHCQIRLSIEPAFRKAVMEKTQGSAHRISAAIGVPILKFAEAVEAVGADPAAIDRFHSLAPGSTWAAMNGGAP